MKLDEAIRIAKRVIKEGKVFREGWYDDGNSESGPSGGSIYGYRLGTLKLHLTPREDIMLSDFSKNRDYPIYKIIPENNNPHSDEYYIKSKLDEVEDYFNREDLVDKHIKSNY